MSIGNNPSIDPSNNGSLAGSMQFAFNKMMQATNRMLPARVINYDRTKNRAQVQLLINMITTDGSQVPRAQLSSVPVMLFGGGGFFISFPLKTDDLGWLLANDRDISLFLQNYNQAPPNTTRMANFSDGVFIPDVMHGYTINGDDEDAVVLQNLNGSTRITINPTDGVKITSPNVEIDGNLTVTGSLTGQSGLNITGTSLLTGDLNVVGNITATGTITPGV